MEERASYPQKSGKAIGIKCHACLKSFLGGDGGGCAGAGWGGDGGGGGGGGG